MGAIDTLSEAADVDVSYLFAPYRHGPVRVHIDPDMYSVKEDCAANWVWHAFRGFARLDRRAGPRSFAAIGSGSGIDAIGAAAIFPDIERIIVTDVEERLVRLAVDNVRGNVGPGIVVTGLAGDVCLPLAAAGQRVDLIYANLPNIPIADPAHAIIDHGTFYRPNAIAADDDLLNRYLLGLQYRFLLSARDALAPGGQALIMIGGRFPYSIFDRLADAAGFSFEEVVGSFKIQTEPENVTAGYAAAETDGLTFDFYDFDRATAAIGDASPPSGHALKTLIAAARLSAGEARALVAAGGRVGHTLHLIRATPVQR